MALGGQKPKPTQLKLITGTARRCRLLKNEPRPELALPMIPPELCDDAKLEWQRMAGELQTLRLLTNIDRAALTAYCAAWGRWVRAERMLRAQDGSEYNGLLKKTAKGNIIQNPLVGVANKAANDMMRFATEFGMTPSSRARVNSLGADQEKDPAAKFFTG